MLEDGGCSAPKDRRRFYLELSEQGTSAMERCSQGRRRYLDPGVRIRVRQWIKRPLAGSFFRPLIFEPPRLAELARMIAQIIAVRAEEGRLSYGR